MEAARRRRVQMTGRRRREQGKQQRDTDQAHRRRTHHAAFVETSSISSSRPAPAAHCPAAPGAGRWQSSRSCISGTECIQIASSCMASPSKRQISVVGISRTPVA